MAADYIFTETRLRNGTICLRWAKRGREFDQLDFWVLPANGVEAAKARIRSGEFEMVGANG
jgi:hypothetical protein